MKLEYLDDISDGGKYKDVVSENLIRLYDFDQSQTRKLADLFLQNLITNNHTVDLSQVDFIEAINCQLTLRISPNDKGILRTEHQNIFTCELTKKTYQTAIEIMKGVNSGFNWLCDTSNDNIDFLYSTGGDW